MKRGTIKTPAWHAWIFPLSMIVLWSIPAVAINVTHGLQAGREPALIVAAVFSVFGAAMCGLRLETPGSPAGKILTAVCLAVLIVFNFSNAVGLSAGHRDHDRSTALTQANTLASLRDDKSTIERTIAALDSELNGASSTSLRAEISAREFDPIFTRSKNCIDATLPESRAHCGAWEKSKALLDAAERRDRLAGELATVNRQLRDAPVRESIDPQSEALAEALAFVGLAVAPRDVGYALVLLFAAGIELMAAFGPGWCGVRLPGRETPQAALAVPQPAPAPAAGPPAADAPGDPLTAFMGELVESRTPMPFRAIWDEYSARCTAAGADPKSKRALGLALSKRFTKSKIANGEVHYAVRMRQGLALVSAVA